jgi:AraC-like DNA-binding protein
MTHFENTHTVKKLLKLFESYSGFKADFIDLKDLKSTSFVPCTNSHCTKYKNCIANISRIRFSGRASRFIIYPCMFNFSIVFIPVYANDVLVRVLRVCETKDTRYKKQTLCALSEFVYEVINYLFKTEFSLPAITGPNYTHAQDVINRVIQFIHANYHQVSLSLKDTADRHNISYYHLSHVFKQQTGMTFIRYVNAVRIEKGKRMLGNLRLNISQVSYAVGYEDPGYFCKLFKKMTKLSPIDYRKKFYSSESIHKNKFRAMPKRDHVLIGSLD